MIDMLKRHEIQVLRRAKHTLEEVAKLAGVSASSVQRVAAEPAVRTLDTAGERVRRGVGRPSKVEALRSLLVAELAGQPDVLAVELLRRARLAGYTGGKSALYELIAAIRPREALQPLVRFEGLPGEFSQHDFGEVDVRFGDGTARRVHFFASRLKYSRWAQVSLADDERVESLVRALVDHFAAIGGVPLLAVFDRPKTVAIAWRRDGVVTEWNSTFAGVVLDLGIGVELCWPYSPRQKGAVENLVGWVKGSFFKQRRFLDEEDLRRQLAEWHDEVNLQRPSRATGVPPSARMPEERVRLRPLKVAPDELALRFPVMVGPTAMVMHEGRAYSMPPEAIGIAGTLYLYRERVRIVAGRFESVHPRQHEAGARSMLPEHRASLVAAVSGRRAKRYLEREHLLELGGPALDYLTELTHRRPRLWVRDVHQLHELLQHHGAAPLRAAFERGLTEHLFGAEYIAHVLSRSAPPSASRRQQELAL
jgi:transposase